MKVGEALDRLPQQHREALEWFIHNTGSVVSWPGPLPSGTLLATKAKGIYKPEWSEYALSVRQTRDSPYADRPPLVLPNGSWLYEYYQEGTDPAARDRYFTNLALLKCSKDHVPIGVLRQDPLVPAEDYRVLGVAEVIGWDGGYFILGGPSSDGTLPGAGLSGELNAFESLARSLETEAGAFDPKGIVDAREKIMAAIVRRRGQVAFRAALLRVYEGRCAVTGCNEAQALEAAHIVPYKGGETNHPTNGLLLRADIHTLFDLGLIAIDSKTMKVVLSPTLATGSYSSLASSPIHLPADLTLRPSKAALDFHRESAGL